MGSISIGLSKCDCWNYIDGKNLAVCFVSTSVMELMRTP